MRNNDDSFEDVVDGFFKKYGSHNEESEEKDNDNKNKELD